MKITFIVLLLSLPLFTYSQNKVRLRQNFDFDWKFLLNQDVKQFASKGFDDSGWQEVQLPHDWSITQPVDKKNGKAMGFLPGGIGWYRKTFTIPANYQGKKVAIHFDGVYHQSDVYINGKHLGFHPYGYTSFEYDLTPYLAYGQENAIAVRVDHSDSPSSRWYSGSGIYRHVWLNVTNPVHVATWGTYITTPEISEKTATVKVATTLANGLSRKETVQLFNKIITITGKELAETSSEVHITKNGKETVEQLLKVENPQLWSIDNPHLYTVETIVKRAGQVIDTYRTPFGIRDIQFDPDKGFLLNGENVKLKGFNLHQDAGSLGTAVPDRSYLRRLQILKEYGVNAIRCSHNPPSPEFLDMCDSLGFVVIDEAFDKWKSGYYEKYFDEWWRKDMDAMLLRDRNHPSIILWSIGNETAEQNWEKGGMERAAMLCDYVHKLEPTRPVTAAIRPMNDKDKPYHKNGFADALDVVGYNYQSHWLRDFKKKFPDQIMYISEAYPYYRGRQDNYKGFNPINPWYDVANNDFVVGQFIWVGIDYLGESTGWPSTGKPTGLFDVCMFEKPRAAFHHSVWNDEPMVKIAVADQSLDIDPGKPHWSWPYLADHWNFPQYKGRVVQVHTTSNCDSVELWVNKESLGLRKTSDYSNNTIVWDVPYEPGIIEAKAYNNGVQVAQYRLQSAGDPARIELSADRKEIVTDGQDLAHIEIRLVDKKGVVVPNADQMISVEVIGSGKLLGLDNSELRKTGYGEKEVKTHWGKALAIVQSTRTEGEIKLKVKVNGLPESTLTVISKKLN